MNSVPAFWRKLIAFIHGGFRGKIILHCDGAVKSIEIHSFKKIHSEDNDVTLG